jgi:NCAIR mutase (PurE)-related protein
VVGPLDHLRRALGASDDGDEEVATVGDFARVDVGRERRKGVPEVVYAPSKTPEQVVEICRRLVNASGRAIVSRAPVETIAALQALGAEFEVEAHPASRTVVVRQPGRVAPDTGGRAAVITAGASDLPYAEEAAIVAREMGCRVRLISDVGVAGLHRLFQPLRELFDEGVDVIVVAAGMDGALPSVVAGLSPVPVIGLPTPVGYGFGGEGVGALTTMLQSCAPGLTVVNIGNGVGAGATAALIANLVARARGEA